MVSALRTSQHILLKRDEARKGRRIASFRNINEQIAKALDVSMNFVLTI